MDFHAQWGFPPGHCSRGRTWAVAPWTGAFPPSEPGLGLCAFSAIFWRWLVTSLHSVGAKPAGAALRSPSHVNIHVHTSGCYRSLCGRREGCSSCSQVLWEWRSPLTEDPCAPGQPTPLIPQTCCLSFPKILWQDKVLAMTCTSQGVSLTPKCEQLPSDCTNPSCVAPS